MLRIGIVGCGRILAAHLKGYRLLREAGHDSFRITALSARRTEDGESYVQRGEGPPQRAPVSTAVGDPLAVGDEYVSDFQDDVRPQVFTDYRQMIDSGLVDAVNDFTTHDLHHQVADAALSQGKHLLTQKPLAVSVAAARRMCEQAEAAGCCFAVFENARFRDDTRHLKWLFDQQLIGDLKMVTLTNIGNWWAPSRVVAETPWRHRLLEGGGLTLDIGVHLFNHLRHLTGEIDTIWGQVSVQEPLRRTSQGTDVACDADDTVICGFQSRRGVHGSLHISWSGHGEPILSGSGRGICYFGEQGSVIGGQIRHDDGTKYVLAELYRERSSAETQSCDFPLGLANQFALNQLDWLQAIEQGREPETSGREGLRDLAAAFAILESSHSGQQVQVDEVADGQLRQWQKEIDERYGIA